MATPLLATARITLPYTIAGIEHKVHLYVQEHGTTSIDGYLTINTRSGNISWAAGIQQWADRYAVIAPSDMVPGTAILEELAGSLWLPVQSYDIVDFTPTVTVHKNAEQDTLTLRDANFKKVRVIMMEGIIGAPAKTTNPSENGFLLGYVNSGADVNDPINWQVSRGNDFLSISPFVSFVTTLNRKLRRARGLA